MNDHCGCSTVQPSDGLSVPTEQPLTNHQPEPQTIYPQTIVTRAPANMPAALQPCEPAGLGPDSNLTGDMNTQSTINPLASSDVGGTAGHVAAACVSTRGECDCERVCDARDASCILPPTTLSPRARQVVVPQQQQHTVEQHYDYVLRVVNISVCANASILFIYGAAKDIINTTMTTSRYTVHYTYIIPICQVSYMPMISYADAAEDYKF